MTERTGEVSQTGIFYACTEKTKFTTEQIIPEHILMHVYSGKLSLVTADKKHIILPGQTVLLVKNQLVKVTKEPDGEKEFRAVTIFFTRPFLQKFYEGLSVSTRVENPGVLYIPKHVLADNLLQSIALYSQLDDLIISDELALLKAKEALTIIRTLNKEVDNILTDFSEPHKIDLSDFMRRNFIFNISITRFAYLTGRSLATFKRDFQKTFGTSPQRWLTEMRLSRAHFLISENNQKPSQVYLEVGFENFSHFTYAFRKFFGYTPSAVMSLRTQSI